VPEKKTARESADKVEDDVEVEADAVFVCVIVRPVKTVGEHTIIVSGARSIPRHALPSRRRASRVQRHKSNQCRAPSLFVDVITSSQGVMKTKTKTKTHPGV
jgi:hypothetical protein